MEIADVSILGCGWLGLPLANKLVQEGYRVKGSTTTPEKLAVLQQQGITAFLINLDDAEQDTETLTSFLEAKILVLNVPPRLRSGGGETYLHQMHLLLKALLQSPVNRVLFVSSTSVYLDLNRIVTEEDTAFTLAREPDNILLQAERLFQGREDWLTTIVRFGGLVGRTRQPGRFFAGKTQVPDGDAPVNLIHQEDCVAILARIIEQQWNKVYNACANEHPLRQEFYTKAARALQLPAPTFAPMEKTSFKLISSQKLQDDLAYTFLHPDPMAFI